jgi:hypothetical protein
MGTRDETTTAAEAHKPENVAIDVAVVRRNPWMMALAALPFLGALAALLAMVVAEPLAGLFVPHLLLFGLVATFVTWKTNPRARLAPERVVIDEEALRIGKRVVPRASIRSGLAIPRDRGVAVEIERGRFRPKIELRAGDEDEARRVLSALGVDASQTTARLYAGSRLAEGQRAYAMGAGLAAAMFATGVIAHRTGGGIAIAALLVPAIAFAVLLGSSTSVDVGTDGLQLRWLWQRRFIPYGEIESVRIEERGVGKARKRVFVARLRSGEEVTLTMSANAFEMDRADALLARVRQAMSEHARGGAADDSLLRRGDRKHADWVRALRSVTERASHRIATPDVERLWQLIENAAIEPIFRAAAAVAISPSLDEAQKKRLEAVRAASAAPKLRIALDAVAEGEDEEALARALAELEVDASRPSARRHAR